MSKVVLAPHEARFVMAILSGVSQGEAYKLAKFPNRKPLSDQNARKEGHRQAIKPHIAEALARAQRDQRQALAITVDDLVAKLERAYDVALGVDPPQTGGAVAATMGIARLLGLVVDKSEITINRNKPSLGPVKSLELTEDEWKRSFDPDLAQK